MAKNTKNKKISIVLELAIGKVQDMIMRMIQVYEPSVLVVGTKGRSSKGFKGLLPGSVSKWCLQHSPIPVVVVKPLDLRQKSREAREKQQHHIESSGHSASGTATPSDQFPQHQAFMDIIAAASGDGFIQDKTFRIYSNNSSSPELHPKFPHYFTSGSVSEANIALGFKNFHEHHLHDARNPSVSSAPLPDTSRTNTLTSANGNGNGNRNAEGSPNGVFEPYTMTPKLTVNGHSPLVGSGAAAVAASSAGIREASRSPLSSPVLHAARLNSGGTSGLASGTVSPLTGSPVLSATTSGSATSFPNKVGSTVPAVPSPLVGHSLTPGNLSLSASSRSGSNSGVGGSSHSSSLLSSTSTSSNSGSSSHVLSPTAFLSSLTNLTSSSSSSPKSSFSSTSTPSSAHGSPSASFSGPSSSSPRNSSPTLKPSSTTTSERRPSRLDLFRGKSPRRRKSSS